MQGEKVAHDKLSTYCMHVHVSNMVMVMTRFNTLTELSTVCMYNPHLGIDKFVVCEQP